MAAAAVAGPVAAAAAAATAGGAAVVNAAAPTKAFSWAEIAKHTKDDDMWLVYDGKVYDVSKWWKRHPGGRVITTYKGQDATEPMQAFHPDEGKQARFLAGVPQVGVVEGEVTGVVRDFRALRRELRSEGYFKPAMWWYLLYLAHVLAIEAAGVWVASTTWGHTTTLGFWTVAAILCTAQIQAGWLQHDFGHLSVFKSRQWNTAMHHFVIGGLKGASSGWWKSRHNRHHAKVNVIHQDPDIQNEPVFIFGEEIAKRRKNATILLPYQEYYWWVVGPPVVTTLLFVVQNLRFVFRGMLWVDIAWMASCYVRFGWTYSHWFSGWQCVGLYFAMRLIESHWFTWVTSMSHLPMAMDAEQNLDWVNLQLRGTQNIDPSAFNNWFSGHLNFQIEHHLFPTMPRHHYQAIQPRVKQLCAKYGVVYRQRGLMQSFGDVLQRLHDVANFWYKYHVLNKK